MIFLLDPFKLKRKFFFLVQIIIHWGASFKKFIPSIELYFMNKTFFMIDNIFFSLSFFLFSPNFFPHKHTHTHKQVTARNLQHSQCIPGTCHRTHHQRDRSSHRHCHVNITIHLLISQRSAERTVKSESWIREIS